jgi:hypothetical protein
MSYGYTRKPSEAQRRRNKARRLVNLSIHEVSSVDSGAAGDHEGRGRAQVLLLKKRDEGANMQIEKHKPYGGLGADETPPTEKMAMAARDLKTADHVLRAFNLAKLNREHSEGRVDNVLYSELLRRMAEAENPGDKNAFAKFMKDHALEMAEKTRADYARTQKAGAIGNGYETAGIGDHQAWAGAVRGGVGYNPPVTGSDVYPRTAANVDGTEHRGTDGSVDKRHPEMITAENIAKLKKLDPSLTFDAAVTMLGRGGK